MESTDLRWRKGKWINVKVIVESGTVVFIREGREGGRILKSWCDIFSGIFYSWYSKRSFSISITSQLTSTNVSFTLLKLYFHPYIGEEEGLIYLKNL